MSDGQPSDGQPTDPWPELDLSRHLRTVSRDDRQAAVLRWSCAAFSKEQATSLPQRGLRLLEEATEAFQSCGGDEEMAHRMVAYVFGRPPGRIGQEIGGVSVCVLALAAAAGMSADGEECQEIARVLSRPIEEFARRNKAKNDAGLLTVIPAISAFPTISAFPAFRESPKVTSAAPCWCVLFRVSYDDGSLVDCSARTWAKDAEEAAADLRGVPLGPGGSVSLEVVAVVPWDAKHHERRTTEELFADLESDVDGDE